MLEPRRQGCLSLEVKNVGTFSRLSTRKVYPSFYYNIRVGYCYPACLLDIRQTEYKVRRFRRQGH